MGWASLIEDVVKRFDAEGLWSFPVPRSGGAPPAKAVAERARLEREKKATAIAIRVFQQNERRLKTLKVESGRLDQQLTVANRELQDWKKKVTQAAKTNDQLNSRLRPYREKFAQRITSLAVAEQPQATGAFDSFLGKIEQFEKQNLGTLDKEAREKFDAIASYALSVKKLKQQEIEIEILTRKLNSAKQEIESLRSFCQQVEQRNRALNGEAKSYEGWEIMDEWLKKNSVIIPKEEAERPVSKKAKKAELPVFNPVFKGAINFNG